ncbi:EcsC family protein [Nocardioides sp. P5_C9_2]
MGLFDLFTPKREQVEETRSALEAAQDPSKDSGPIHRVIDMLLDIGLDGRGPIRSASQIADKALRKEGSTEKALKAVGRGGTLGGGVGGFVTGVGGFVTLPVALPANVLEFYVQATRMVGAIAQLRGYDLSDERIRSAVLLTLVGSRADDVLEKAGMSTGGGRLATLATRGMPPAAIMMVNKAVGFNLMRSVGVRTIGRFGRGVPVIGGFIGGGLDAWMMKKIADHAMQEFPATTGGSAA